MGRRRHPKKAVEAAFRYAEARHWIVEPKASGHAWGEIRCRAGTRGGCRFAVWSTPRSPENHAAQLKRRIDACPHA
jgi:hypothetical protein